MSARRDRQFTSFLELPEIISGLLILFIVVWILGFQPMEQGKSESVAFQNAGHILVSGLVLFNSASVLLHVLACLFHRYKPSRLLLWQLFSSCAATFVLAGLYRKFLPLWAFWLGLALDLSIGVFSCLNLYNYWQARRRPSPLNRRNNWSAAAIFFSSLVTWILISTLMLMTPGASIAPLKFVDAFFMCASCTSITGLSCVSIPATFSPLGKLVLLADIQVGAMGVVTFTYFVLMMVGRRLDFQDSRTISTIFDQESNRNVGDLIKAIVFLSFSIEFIGAVLLYNCWKGQPGIPQHNLWFYATFHSVSAFCNAGTSLFSGNMAESCVRNMRSCQAVMMFLMMAGTMGFGVYLEGINRLRRRLQGKHNVLRWTTHSWLVIRVTLIVLLSGSLIFGLLGYLEPCNHDQALCQNFWEGAWNSIGRSAGFNLSNLDQYGPVYKLFLCVLMFIGGNPAGTGGGVFAPVVAICLLEVLRVLRGAQDVTMHGRRIARSTVERAMATVVLSLCWIAFTTMLLLLLEPKIAAESGGVVRVLFEEVSAYTTTGYSLGITSELSDLSKIIISLNMIFGRVGMFTFMMVFIKQSPPQLIRYPETKLPLT